MVSARLGSITLFELIMPVRLLAKMKKVKINSRVDRQISLAASKNLPHTVRNSSNVISQGSRGVSKTLRSQLYVPRSSWEQSQQQVVCSLLEGQRIVKASFRRGTGMMVLKLFLENGGQAVIEPVIAKRGYHGLMITSGIEASPVKFQYWRRTGLACNEPLND